jgi:multidrug efflux pump
MTPDESQPGARGSGVSGPFIARPVATSLLAIAILLSCGLSYFYLPISSLPQVDYPVILVQTQLPGASADTMAKLVTAPLERQLSQIPALQSMNSTSSEGLSLVTLQFQLDRNINAAGQDVDSAISAANANLPQGLPYPPFYSKVNPSDPPIVTLAMSAESQSMEKLSDLADTFLGPKLSQVSGVGHVTVQGNVRPAVRVRADLPRLASYGIGLETLRTAIGNANVSGSKGQLNGEEKAFTIGANDQLTTPKEYENVVVAYSNGAPVLLKDVATITGGLENNRTAARYNGAPAVIIDVQRQPGANIVQTVDEIKRRLPNLESALPAGVKLRVAADRTSTIRASVSEVQYTLVIAVVLVVLVVLLFLRTMSATIVAGITLPLSIVSTFGVMWFLGFSLDNLSLMALTIATGFVVDDAIVMIENIMRYIEMGEKPMEAAYKGAGEIGFTIISLTLSLIAVFIPLLFMAGIVGRLFREFALTLTVSVVVSAIISLTLTPMLCSRLLKNGGHEHHRRNWLAAIAEAPFDGMFVLYRSTLDVVLRFRRTTLLVTAATLVITMLLYAGIAKGFLPDQDTGFLTAETEAAQNISIARMQELQNQVEAVLRRDPDVVNVVSVVGAGTTNLTQNTGHFALTLKPKQDRTASAKEIMDRLAGAVHGIPGIATYLQIVQDIQIGVRKSRTQYQYVLTGTDPDIFSLWANRLLAEVKNDPRLMGVSSDLQENGASVAISVDRLIAGRLGVAMSDINNTLYDAFGQRQISTIYGQSNQYRVVLEADPRYQTDPAALGSIYVPASSASNAAATSGGTATQGITALSTAGGSKSSQVPLGVVATFRRSVTPLVVSHSQQFPAAAISFDLAPGVSLDQGVEAITSAAERIGLPSSVTGSFTGAVEEFNLSLRSQPVLILAALIVIYIVLGVLYESFIHPFTILTTLPSAGIGALVALMLFGMDFSFIALIGIVLLMGIVKKNAIIMIDFALEAERHRGMSAAEAIREACLLRFRPIMMTTVAALLGAVPLVLGHGAGSELRVPLGITIIGGLLLSQMLTLYTTPVVYLAMDRMREKLMGARTVPGDEPAVAGE